MIFLFIIKPRVKKVRNTIHDIPVYNQTSCKKVRNTIHDIPVYNQTSCKKVRNKIHDIQPVHDICLNQTSCKNSKKYNS